MTRRIAIILNPYAGRGKALKRRAELEKALEETAYRLSLPGSSYWRIIESEEPGHAEELARDAAAFGFEVVAAAGGDGTLSEVANGVAKSNVNCLLGVIPFGTGNDFARCIGIGTDLHLAIETLFSGEVRKIDAGRVVFLDDELSIENPLDIPTTRKAHIFEAKNEAEQSESEAVKTPERQETDGDRQDFPLVLLAQPASTELPGRLFLNIAGCGIDAVVADRVNQGFGFIGGTAAYLAALAQSLLTYRATNLTLSLGNEVREVRAMFCCVANATSYGGGMKVAPNAELDDGLFDICLLKETGKLDFLKTFPKVFAGKHIDHPKVEIFRAGRLIIESDPPLPVLVDGDVLGKTPFEIQIVPNALSFLFPSNQESGFPAIIPMAKRSEE